MALQHLPKEVRDSMPIEVQELIWEFGFHLKLATIRTFIRTVRVIGQQREHHIWRLAVDLVNLPHGVSHTAYYDVLGIPVGFYCDAAYPLVLETMETPLQLHLGAGEISRVVWWYYDTVAETYVRVLHEHRVERYVYGLRD